MHEPPLQAVMSLLFVLAQAPEVQLAVLHGVGVAHWLQDPPVLPQEESDVPLWQVFERSQHPVQQVPLVHVPPLQAVPLMAGTAPHLPAAQVSMVHALLSSHLVHAFPPVPQLLEAAPDWQTPPLTHPVQQTPLMQIPPLQAVPSLSPVEAHLPVAQVAEAQLLDALHVEHAPPPVPQAERLVPPWQVVPLQHPVQQVPFLQVPPLQVVPTGAGELVHTLLVQAGVAQALPAGQTEHLDPAGPQALMLVPA